MPAMHPWDLAALDIQHWLTNEPAYYVDALKGGYKTPFAADVNEQQKLDYYRRQVFMQNPDGSPDYSRPNESGRQMLIKRIGIDGYTQVMGAVMPKPGLAIAASQMEHPYDEAVMQNAHQTNEMVDSGQMTDPSLDQGLGG